MRSSAALLLALTLTGCATTSAPRGIYFVMVDRFANGDAKNDGDANLEDPQAFHGGDLQGVIDHLDWVKALGFDTIWLSPIFKMRTEKWHGFGAFHGYWTWDLGAVEPRFGDELLLAKLRSELDRRGMKLILDLVLNHVGPDAPLLTQHADWFHRRGGVTDWNDATQLVMNDVHGLPDLATEKPEVYDALLTASRRWVEIARPDGFRLDAVKHLPIEFWEKFNGEFPFIKLGELLDGDPGTVSGTWREGGFTSMFDFPLAFAIADVFCRGESPAKLAAVLTNDRRYPDPSKLVTLVDNHDLPRIVSTCGGDLEKTKQALSFLFAMRGVPSISWGTEVALEGAKEPDNRKSMTFIEHPLRSHIADWMKKRADSVPLREGSAVPTEVSEQRVVISRIAADGSAVDVMVQDGKVTLSAPHPMVRPVGTRRVTIKGEGSVVGSGPELGDWDRRRAVALPVTLDLPLNGVFEFKRIVQGEWEAGPNHLLFVQKDVTVE